MIIPVLSLKKPELLPAGGMDGVQTESCRAALVSGVKAAEPENCESTELSMKALKRQQAT